MDTEIIIADDIKSKILTIRGTQVMIDRDLAEFYGIKSIRLREQVKRNPKRFPPDFMFQLTDEEVEIMVSHNAIPSRKYLGGHLPYAFTEQGVASLSSVLTSDRAIEVNLLIMRTFVTMRRFLSANADIFRRLDSIEHKQLETDLKVERIFDAIEFDKLKSKQGIFFNGQIFDAYNFVADLIRSAENSIILIDNYIDDSVLTLFGKRNAEVKVKIFTKNISEQLRLDLQKFNSQYEAIEIIQFSDAHDRFLIIDNKHLYHFGASLKDLGKKWFAFSKMELGFTNIMEKLTV